MFSKPKDNRAFRAQIEEALKDIDIQPVKASAYHADWEHGPRSVTGLFRYRLLDVDNPFLSMNNKLRWSILRKTETILPTDDWTLDIVQGEGTVLVTIRW